MRSLFLTISVSSIVQLSYGMQLSNPLPLQPSAPTLGSTTNYTSHPSQTFDLCDQPRQCPINHEHPVVIAAKEGDLETIKEYFIRSTHIMRWYVSWFLPCHNENIEIAKVLEAATNSSYKKTRHVVAWMLARTKPDYVEKPECLLSTAINNGHVNVITFIAAHYPNLVDAAFDDAITQGHPSKIAMLLKAEPRVDGAQILEIDHSKLLYRALNAFSPKDTQAKAEERLTLFKSLLKGQTVWKLKKNAPLGFEIDLCNVHEAVRQQLTCVLNKVYVPAKVCMQDEPEMALKAASPSSDAPGYVALGVVCCPILTISALLECNKRFKED